MCLRANPAVRAKLLGMQNLVTPFFLIAAFAFVLGGVSAEGTTIKAPQQTDEPSNDMRSAGRRLRASCKAFSGYTVTANVDHYGNDIAKMGSSDAAAKACSANSACLGFNSNGWIKTVVSPVQPYNGVCFYVKKGNNGCKALTGYTVTPNVDHNGDDITNTGSLDAALQACSANSVCLGFNSQGWIKTVVSPMTPYSGMCFYTKNGNTGCKALTGYTVTPNVDHNGDDITNTGSLDTALQACSANSACLGFNSQGWIKTVVSPTTPYSGMCFYTKNGNTGCKTFSGYSTSANVDHDGDDIANYGSNMDAAAQACSANSNCAGFNSDGWTKTKVSPTQRANGYCLYIKNGGKDGKVFFGPYKDVTIHMNWNTYVISTNLNDQIQPVLQVMPGNALTWAFASGQCGSETWAGVKPSDLVKANVQAFVNAGKKYIISTGGAAGVFTCNSDAGFATFIDTYKSTSLAGIDFDIEGGQSQGDIANLVQRVKVARRNYPNLRFSFTLATMNGASGNQLNTLGTWTMEALKAANMGWNNIFINLMVMDYGGAVSNMGQAAVNAAKALQSHWSVPYSSIELTPMIGGNDSPGETFTLADVSTLTSFALSNGIGGVHHWSLDRDKDCPPGSASPTCNTYGQAGTLGFTNAFISRLV